MTKCTTTSSPTPTFSQARRESADKQQQLERNDKTKERNAKNQVPTGRVALKGGKSSRYCADEYNQIKCNRGHVQGWEKFTIRRLGGNKYSLKGGKGNRYCADEGNNVKCNRGHVHGWERFTIVPIGGNKYSLKGGKNNRYCADEGNRIKCNRGHVHGWERFTITKLRV